MSLNDDYDMVLIAGRAMRPEEYAKQDPPVRWRVWQSVIAENAVPPTYPGSIEKPCEQCGIGVQVGPRQQEKIAELDEAKVMILCLVDASLAAAENQTTVHNLGNPHKETS